MSPYKKRIYVYAYVLSMVVMGCLLFFMWAARMIERDGYHSELLLDDKRISTLAVLCEDVTPMRLETAEFRNNVQFKTCTPSEWSYYYPWMSAPPEGTTSIYHSDGVAFYFKNDKLLQIDAGSYKSGPVRFDQGK